MKDKDFTLYAYETYLKAAIKAGYRGVSVLSYMNEVVSDKVIILRQDVDKRPDHSVQMAQLQSDLGVQGTYYFRMVPESFDEACIKAIADLGHEIGYHYEDVAVQKGNMERAWDMFQSNLDKLRKLYPVKTVCMHGSPLSRWDNRTLWDQYDYKSLDIICEPYLDIDFEKVFYLTDTGRAWNNKKASRRDYVNQNFNIQIQSTFDLALKFEEGIMPPTIMQNVHPQRWTNDPAAWRKEKWGQAVKNVVKRMLK